MMASHRESVIMAAIVVILISIPAASQTVEISGEDTKIGVIESEFSDRFEAEFKPGKVVNRLIDSEAKLEVNKSFERNVKHLQTAEGSVKVVKTNNSIENVVQTPYGRFEFGVENGEDYERFEGENQERAEKVRDSLMSEMEERSKEVNEKHELVVQEMLPDIRVSVSEGGDDEHFNLTNTDEGDVDLKGWSVLSKGSSRDYYNLTGSIESGETKTFYSNTRSEVSGVEDAVYGTDTTVYSDGAVRVYNTVDILVDGSDY